jgi:hypothetical protein
MVMPCATDSAAGSNISDGNSRPQPAAATLLALTAMLPLAQALSGTRMNATNIRRSNCTMMQEATPASQPGSPLRVFNNPPNQMHRLSQERECMRVDNTV